MGLLIAYPLICSMALCMLTVLAEATCLFPTTGSFIDHANRFVDPALGFAIGFCEWFGAITVVAAEGSVFPVVISYWTTSISSAGLMTIYLVVVFGFHVMPNRWFGEFEFYSGVVKLTTMVIVMLTMIAICAGAGNGDEYIGQNYNTLELFPNGFKVRYSQPFLIRLKRFADTSRVSHAAFFLHLGQLEDKKSWALLQARLLSLVGICLALELTSSSGSWSFISRQPFSFPSSFHIRSHYSSAPPTLLLHRLSLR